MNFNKKIISILVVICALFLSLALYLTYFSLFNADEIINSAYNRRMQEKEDSVLRGDIFDRSGVLLARSVKDGNFQKREYPYKGLYTHALGYSSRTYGKTGIEQNFNRYLLAEDILEGFSGGIVSADMPEGAELRLTLDHKMTQQAAQLMGGKNGAVVALNPRTGETLCLYSNPTFDPTESALEKNWGDLADSSDSPFLPRATMGLYAPGSTFKTVIAAAAIKNGLSDYSVEDEGRVLIGGKEFRNSDGKSYGELDLTQGFAKSSNVMFASLAARLGQSEIKGIADSFYIGKAFDFDLLVSASRFPYSGMSETELAAVGIGQGKLLVTPLNMALCASAIANNGVMMHPYVVEKAVARSGRVLYAAQPRTMTSSVSAAVAARVRELMVECVKNGTGTAARISGVKVAGKTGTAENEVSGKTHAWFICFAPADNPEIAIAVIQEYSGKSGGAVCAPIARKLMQSWLGR